MAVNSNRGTGIMNSCVFLLVFFECVTGFYVHPDVVFFSSEPEESVTCEGCSVELTCEVKLRESELPQPVIEWQVNGTAVSDVFIDVSISYFNSDADVAGLYHRRSSLSIASTQLEHSGVYRCVARDGEDEDLCDVHPCVPTITVSGEARLYVLGNYSGPHHMVTVSSCSVTVLQCGSLPSKEAVELIYVWKRNGVELDQNEEDVPGGSPPTSGSGGSLDTYVLPTGGLVLYSYGQGVSGQYECVATVKGNILTMDHYDVQQSTGSIPSSPAVTVFTTTPFRTTNSSQPQLVCVVNDFCPETIQWRKDGILVAGDAVVHYPSLPSEVSVTSYCCEATAGNETFSGCVEIQTFTEPTVTTEHDTTVLLDDPQDNNITLHCSTSDTIHWSHNGETLSNSSTGMLVVSRFNTTAELYGVYQCFVSNPAGCSVAVIRVLPRGIPNPPRNIQIMEIPWPRKDKRPAIRIDWSPPLYRAGLDRLLYQVVHVIGYLNTSQKITNETFIDVFAAGYGNTRPQVMIIDPDAQETVIVSEMSSKLYRVEGLCVDEVLFPPVLHLSCVGPDGTIQWDNDPDNDLTYPEWSTPQYYIIRGICTLPGTSPLAYDETFSESGHDSVQGLPIGTLCAFQGVALPEPTRDFYEPCYDTSLVKWSTGGCTITAIAGFEHQEYTVHENNGTVEVCVEAVGFGFSVSIATNNSGTAQVGEDYIEPLGILDFPSNDPTRRCIIIYIIDDMVVENTVEHFIVTVVPTNDTLVEITSNATINIIDTSTAGFSFTQPSYAVSEDDGFVIVCVSEDTELRRDILLTLSTQDVTAFAGQDYIPFEETFTYDASTNTHCVNITIVDDNYVEGGEEFHIQLHSEDPAVELPTDSAVVEVVDNDGAVIGIESPRYVVDEHVGSVVVCVALESGNLRRDILVTLATLNDTAIAGEDFEQVETEFTFSNFENRHCVDIHILNTTSVEGTKIFTVFLRIDDPQVIVGFSTASAVIEITGTDVMETSSSTPLTLGIALGVLPVVVIGVLVGFLSVFLLYRWNKRSALKNHFFPIFPGAIEKTDLVDPEKWYDDTMSILTELDPLQQEPDIPVQNIITIHQDLVPVPLHFGTTAEACRKISDNSGCTDSTSPYIYPPSIIDSGIDSGQSNVLPPRRFFSSDLHESSPLEALPTLSDKDERGLAATVIPEFRDDSAISLDSEEHCYLETQV